MEESAEQPIRQPKIQLSSSHRQSFRPVLLDSSDRPEGQQPRIAQAIPIPGGLGGRNGSGYSYSDSFSPGSRLGTGTQNRNGLVSRTARPAAMASAGLSDIGLSTPSGEAAMRRRIYDKPTADQHKIQRRKRSHGGFERARPSREPLTPHTHDNKTGKGRIASSSRKKDNPLSRYEQSETDVVDIDTTPIRSNAPIAVASATPSNNKKQKIQHGPRRQIKINYHEASSDVDSEPAGLDQLTKSRESRALVQQSEEPIEIGSDEDSTMKTLSKQSPPPRQRIGQLRSTNSAVARQVSNPKVVRLDNSSEVLQYPSSDSDLEAEKSKMPQPTFDYDSSIFKVSQTKDSRQTTSPYFAANNTHSAKQDHGSVSHQLVLTDQVTTKAHKFAIFATGGQIQSIRRGWSLLLADAGFRLLDEKDSERVGAFLAVDNISSWYFHDDTGIISVTLKRITTHFWNVTSVYFTLENIEIHRFLRLLQNLSTSHPLFRRYHQDSAMQQENVRKSYAMLRAMVDSPRRASNHSPEIISSKDLAHAISPISNRHPRLINPDAGQASGERLQTHSTPDRLDNALEVYHSAVPGSRKPQPIQIPKGRIEHDRQQEHPMLVDKNEVKAANSARLSPEVSQNTTRTTRNTARAAELRITRDARASEPLLVYPQIKGQTSVTLYEEDLDRLAPDEFLNDSIVEFYLRYNYDNLSDDQREQAHVFNTFFYQRLTSSKDKDANYEAVKKWTSKGKGVDIFSKKFLVIPINENLHWYLAVVVNLNKVIYGADVARAQIDSSFIDAIEDDDESEAETIGHESQEFDTSNILAELDHVEGMNQGSGNRHIDKVCTSDPVHGQEVEEDKPASVISQTPSVEAVKQTESKANDFYDFCDDPTPRETKRMSMTDSIRAEELAQRPHLRRSERGEPSEAKAMEDLTLEDSIVVASQEIPRTYGRALKKKNARKSGPGFSKAGKHIPTDTPTIIILDSLNNNHNRVYDVIRDYLVREAQDKKNEILSPKQFATCKADLPRQDNFSDCGLFLIQYAQTLLSQPNVVPQLLNRVKFSTQTASEAHKRAFKNMFEIDRIPRRREEMIQQIKQLSIPYRKQAKIDEEQRKHDRAVAKAQRDADESNNPAHEKEAETSCALISPDKNSLTELTPPQEVVKVPRPLDIQQHEDSIDEMNLL